MNARDIRTRVNTEHIAFAKDLYPASFAASPFAEEFARCHGVRIWPFRAMVAGVCPLDPTSALPAPQEDEQEEAKAIGRQFEKHRAAVTQQVAAGLPVH